jgi:hypothetical protein
VALAVVFLTLTISSADAERGFSTMKRIKTALRNTLGQACLEQLMFISINGPPLEKFDVLAAVRLFVNLKTRRVQPKTLVSAEGKKLAEEAVRYVWGSDVPAERVEEERKRELLAADSTRLFTGHAPLSAAAPARDKRKEAAGVALKAKKKSRHEEGRDATLAIGQADQVLLQEQSREASPSPVAVQAGASVSEDSREEGLACGECAGQRSSIGNEILLCDSEDCETGIHQRCLSPPLEELPSGKWFCPVCDAARERSSRGRARAFVNVSARFLE